MLASTRFAWTGALLVMLGCGDDAPADAGGERDGGSDAAAHDAGIDGDASADAAAAGDAAIVVPPNDSFETARALDLAAPPPLQDVTHAGQSDYYSFEAEAGAFYVLSTELGFFTPDTVIELFDPDQQPLAMNDDGSMWPGDTFDSRLVVRLSRAGTHFVRVQNHVDTDPVMPPVFYHLTVRRLDPEADGVAVQKDEQPAPVHFMRDVGSGYAYATLVGDFAAVQRAAFDLEGETDQVLVGHVLPFGPEQNGSTARVGVVRIADADDHVVGQIDGAKQQQFVHPPLTDGTYRLTAELDGDAGENGFFAIDLVMLPDNPRELSEEDNDALEGADNVELEQEMFRRRGLLLSSLAAKDVDYFRFEAPTVGYVTAACEGESGGSGVRGLHVEVRDSDDAILAAADEPADMNLLIDTVELTEPGTYYLRLSSATKAGADQPEPWVRCVVIARP